MSFLLDTNIVSFHLKHPRGLMHRFVQYSGRLYISSVALAELYDQQHSPARCRLAAAIEWYREGRISQGQGAEIAGLNRAHR